MALSDELLEQIGAYLSGQLPTDEKARFEFRLQQDADLREEVTIQRELKQGLAFLAQKDRFRQMHTDLAARGLLDDPAPGPMPNPVRNDSQTPIPAAAPVPAKRRVVGYGLARWAMAASVVIVLGVGWVVYRKRMDKQQALAQNERVFSTFFLPALKPSPALAADPDRLAASPDKRQTGVDSARLQSAVGLVRQTDLQSAIQALTDLSSGRPGHWSASAQWYLALAYLRNNQPAETRRILQEISPLNGHPYQTEARQLLRQLPVDTD